jgi:hypothetical protein
VTSTIPRQAEIRGPSPGNIDECQRAWNDIYCLDAAVSGGFGSPVADTTSRPQCSLASGLGAGGDLHSFSWLFRGSCRWRNCHGGFQWVPSYNVSFSWLIDGLSLTFALLISGIGALIILYSGGYLKGHGSLDGSSPSCCCSWARCSAW